MNRLTVALGNGSLPRRFSFFPRLPCPAQVSRGECLTTNRFPISKAALFRSRKFCRFHPAECKHSSYVFAQLSSSVYFELPSANKSRETDNRLCRRRTDRRQDRRKQPYNPLFHRKKKKKVIALPFVVDEEL